MKILKPDLFSMPARDQLELFRAIVINNGLSYVNLEVEVAEAFLPRVLVDLGLFPSTSQVKKNKPQLFREVVDGETIKVGRFNLTLRLSPI